MQTIEQQRIYAGLVYPAGAWHLLEMRKRVQMEGTRDFGAKLLCKEGRKAQ